jgi:hypothetical protein
LHHYHQEAKLAVAGASASGSQECGGGSSGGGGGGVQPGSLAKRLLDRIQKQFSQLHVCLCYIDGDEVGACDSSRSSSSSMRACTAG